MSKLQASGPLTTWEKACSPLLGDDTGLIKLARYSESPMSKISPIPPRTLQRTWRVDFSSAALT